MSVEAIAPQSPRSAGAISRPAEARWINLLAAGAIVVGVLVRGRQYLASRSLWLDESLIALEIQERGLAQLFEPLGRGQAAPAGFLVLEKLAIQLLGTSEYALRLVPFLAGIAVLPLLWIVARRLAGAGAALACLALAVPGEHLIYYSNEVKQYSTDLLFCLLILLNVHPLLEGQARTRHWLTAAVVGAVAVWFSHPAIFVLGATGLTLAVLELRRERALRLPLVAMASAWLAGFAANWLVVLRRQTGSEFLVNWWQQAFPPRDGVPVAQLRWLYDRMIEYMADPAGLASASLAIFAALIGIVALARRRRDFLAIVALVFVAALLAATLRMYPFRSRLLLFTLPLFLMTAGAGIARLGAGRPRAWWPGLLLLSLLMAHPLLRAARIMAQPAGREEIKAVINYAADRMQPQDGLYLGYTGHNAFRWYASHTRALRHPPDRTMVGAHISLGADSVRAEVESLRRYRRVWMVFVHYWPDDLEGVIRHVEPLATQHDEFTAPGALVRLYEFRPPALTRE